MTLQQACDAIRSVDKIAMRETEKRLDSIIKPLKSLGLLEKHLIKIAGITRHYQFDFSRKAVVVFCADNGIVAEGITQSGQDVTAIVSENMITGDTCLCAMARIAKADVIPVDIGIACDLPVPGILQKKVAYGTSNFVLEPAMTTEQAILAIETGIGLAEQLYRQGYHILATGEMGIGNTTTSAAVAAVLLNLPPREVTGRGAGLSTPGLEKKICLIERALALHNPDSKDPLDVLAKVGGFDIAGIAGLCIGGAVYGIPIVLDGFISTVAALVAQRICPGVTDFLLPSHLSTEPASEAVMRELGLKPLLQAEMRLGEGTGAVATLPLYDMILAVYNEMVSFQEEDMEAYQPFG